MSAFGQYSLTLLCDGGESCPRLRQSALFVADTRAGAREQSRQEGWLITRDAKAFCQDCTPKYLDRPNRWKARSLDGNLMPLERRPESAQ